MLKKNTAALLSLLLGGIGGQFFYLGKIGWGIVMLVFCWSFIPMIIGVYDFFMFSFMSQERFNMRYNSAVYVMNHKDNVADELEKLGRLRAEGVLTDKEFEARKRSLLK